MTAISIPKVAVKEEPKEGEKNGLQGVLTAAPYAAVDLAGKVTSLVDGVLTFPKVVFGALGKLPLPGSKLVGDTLGSIFSAVGGAMVHGYSFGALKWLQGLKRHLAVSETASEMVGDGEEIGETTVKGFLSTVRSKSMRADLMQYFRLTKALGNEKAPEADKEVIKKELAGLELKLGRTAELTGLKRLALREGDLKNESHLELDQLAERVATTMIARVGSFYKDKVGAIGSTLEGNWVKLAEKGEEGKPALIAAVKEKLLSAYEKERAGQSAKEDIATVKAAVGEAFMSKSAFREATFYSVFGVLAHTGLLGTVIDVAKQGAETLGGFMAKIVPDWVTDAVNTGLSWVKATAAGALAYFGIKTGAAVTKAVAGSETAGAKVTVEVKTSPEAAKVLADKAADGTALLKDAEAKLKALDGVETTKITEGASKATVIDGSRLGADGTLGAKLQIDPGALKGIHQHVERVHVEGAKIHTR